MPFTAMFFLLKNKLHTRKEICYITSRIGEITRQSKLQNTLGHNIEKIANTKKMPIIE